MPDQNSQAFVNAAVSFAGENLKSLVNPAADEDRTAQAGKILPLLENSLPSGPLRECLAAAIWLAADELERAHHHCQDIPGPYGAAWHAVVHRREGDFSNSKYWWRQAKPVRWKNVMELIRSAIARAPGATPRELQQFLSAERYDPVAFVDLVEAQHPHGDAAVQIALIEIQRAEWLWLFDECRTAATL